MLHWEKVKILVKDLQKKLFGFVLNRRCVNVQVSVAQGYLYQSVKKSEN